MQMSPWRRIGLDDEKKAIAIAMLRGGSSYAVAKKFKTYQAVPLRCTHQACWIVLPRLYARGKAMPGGVGRKSDDKPPMYFLRWYADEFIGAIEKYEQRPTGTDRFDVSEREYLWAEEWREIDERAGAERYGRKDERLRRENSVITEDEVLP